MTAPTLTRQELRGVTLLGDQERPCGVTLAFTERTGGVSAAPFASLNLGDACGDEPEAVAENRRRALGALGCADLLDRLVNPRQVHGDHVVVVGSSEPDALAAAVGEARAGADAVVCTCEDVPVLLCYAVCVPVMFVCPGGFAVVHSGWRGTEKRIAAKALRVLLERTGAAPTEALAYVGPHIGVADYEVSPELAARFSASFGPEVVRPGNSLDLGRAVALALLEAGLGERSICDCGISTAASTNRFYSYRAEGGHCGRHGALAIRRGSQR